MELNIPHDREGSLEPKFNGTENSPALIAKVAKKVLDGVKEWQARPLDDMYPVVFLDAIHYKIRQGGMEISKAVYTCLIRNSSQDLKQVYRATSLEDCAPMDLSLSPCSAKVLDLGKGSNEAR